jgi:hypothetical protein
MFNLRVIPLRFSKANSQLGENQRVGYYKGYHAMWKPPNLIMKTKIKALKILTKKMKTAQHWF